MWVRRRSVVQMCLYLFQHNVPEMYINDCMSLVNNALTFDYNNVVNDFSCVSLRLTINALNALP